MLVLSFFASLEGEHKAWSPDGTSIAVPALQGEVMRGTPTPGFPISRVLPL